ncbi:MAG: radical SAM protein [bacterium]|nr:radical SAM protein [bacterium]
MFDFDYDEPLFRPPAESASLIFQVTLGCSWNKCAFCRMYTSKTFTVRNEEEVMAEINEAAAVYPGVRKVFLADGNAMVLSARRLLRILTAIKKAFPGVGRVSAYALPKDISAKSADELATLRNAGLQLVYVGIESGDDPVLRMINKNESADSTVEGLLKAQDADINCSVMIVNGLAGLKYSEQHAVYSAKILNRIQPRFFSTLVLMLPFGDDHYKETFAGTYIHMGVMDLRKELELLIKNTELDRTIFRSDHASNFLPLKGILSRDKEKLLKMIRED